MTESRLRSSCSKPPSPETGPMRVLVNCSGKNCRPEPRTLPTSSTVSMEGQRAQACQPPRPAATLLREPMNPIRRRVTGPFLLCVPCIAAGCHREESPSRATVGLPSISAAPPVLIEAGPTPEAGPTEEATAPSPRIAIALDADKGRSALADYRKALASLCDELRSDAGDGAAKLKSFGLDGAEPASLCTDVDRAG